MFLFLFRNLSKSVKVSRYFWLVLFICFFEFWGLFYLVGMARTLLKLGSCFTDAWIVPPAYSVEMGLYWSGPDCRPEVSMMEASNSLLTILLHIICLRACSSVISSEPDSPPTLWNFSNDSNCRCISVFRGNRNWSVEPASDLAR